jgi:general secretion pathway protein H
MPISATGNSSDGGPTPQGRSAGNGFTGLRRSAENGFTGLRRSAENGFTGLRRSAENGFTLVELMVVLVIIGLMSAVVVFAMPDPRGALEREAEKFAARALAARDAAIVTARPTRLRADGTGYAFDQRHGGNWVPIADRPFRAEAWGPGVTASPSGDVSFDPAGGADPQIQFILQRNEERVTILIASDGAVRVGG